MADRVTVPAGYQIFVTCTSRQPDGAVYGVEFLAKDWEHARRVCEWCGLSTEQKDLGTLEMTIEETPDGLMTTWDKDAGGDLPDDWRPPTETKDYEPARCLVQERKDPWWRRCMDWIESLW